MNSYKHILFPTDLSDASEPAADRARSLQRLTGAKLTVLNVVDYVPPGWVAAQLPEDLSSEAGLVERAQNALTEWLTKTGIGQHTQNIQVGSPKKIIVDTAREVGADLIVMGTHGDRGLARIIGSTARGVLHDASCDVLVVHTS